MALAPGQFGEERSQWHAGGGPDPWGSGRRWTERPLPPDALAQDTAIGRENAHVLPLEGVDLFAVEPGNALAQRVVKMAPMLISVEQGDPFAVRGVDGLHRDTDLRCGVDLPK